MKRIVYIMEPTPRYTWLQAFHDTVWFCVCMYCLYWLLIFVGVAIGAVK